MTISELCGPLSFKDFILRGEINDETFFYSIFLQVSLSLLIAQEQYNYIHTDLHAGNVLIKELDKPIKIKYITKDNVYFLTTKYIAQIIDYGYSSLTFNQKRIYQLDIERKSDKDVLFRETLDYMIKGNVIDGYDIFHLFMISLTMTHHYLSPLTNMSLTKYIKNYYKSLPGFDNSIKQKFINYYTNRDITNKVFLNSLNLKDFTNYLITLNSKYNILS
jgi:predicted unusual protein kinase regulating ubiquinone biosynthesis (AarF/ABC1/UbiB family)